MVAASVLLLLGLGSMGGRAVAVEEVDEDAVLCRAVRWEVPWAGRRVWGDGLLVLGMPP